MTDVGQRLRVLALGFLAPLLAFAAIALSGAPSALAIEEEPWVPASGYSDCEMQSLETYCTSDGGCVTLASWSCNEGDYLTLYPYDPDDVSPEQCTWVDFVGIVCW